MTTVRYPKASVTPNDTPPIDTSAPEIGEPSLVIETKYDWLGIVVGGKPVKTNWNGALRTKLTAKEALGAVPFDATIIIV